MPLRHRGGERAFTIIEMIVVTALMLVVITMALKFMMDVMVREREGVTSKRASERTMVALDQMGADFRSTISLDRATGGGLGLDDLDFVTNGYLPAGADRAAFVAEHLDIVSASKWRVELMVPANGTTRCVTYDMQPSTGRLTRTLSTGCPATSANHISEDVVLASVPRGVTPVAPFRFWALGAAPTCTVYELPEDVTFNALAGTGDMRTLYRLSSVEVDLRSFAQAGRAKGSAKLATEFAFRSRLSTPYRRAGGCTT